MGNYLDFRGLSHYTDNYIKPIKSNVNSLINRDKNLLFPTASQKTGDGVTFTIDNEIGIVIANGTANGDNVIRLSKALYTTLTDGIYILSGCPMGGSSTTYGMDVTRQPGAAMRDYGEGVEFEIGNSDYLTYYPRIVIFDGYTANNLIFYPMICTKEAWTLSHEFVPYGKGIILNSEIDTLWST